MHQGKGSLINETCESSKSHNKLILLQVLILEDHLPGIRKERYVPSRIIVHGDGDDGDSTTIDISHISLPGASKMEVYKSNIKFQVYS